MENTNTGQASELLPYLKRIGGRLRLRAGWVFAQQSLWLAGLAMLGVQLAGRVWPVERLWAWTLAPLAVWALANLLYALFRPQAAMSVARRTDLELGLKERLSTALLLADSKDGS